MASSKSSKKKAEYWTQREAKWKEQLAKDEAAAHKRREDVYALLEAEINEQIAAWEHKYAQKEGITDQQGQENLSKVDMEYFSRLAKKYCQQAAADRANGSYRRGDSLKDYFTEAANREMRYYNAGMKISRLKMIQSQMHLRIANAQAKTEEIIGKALEDTAFKELKRQAGILGRTVMDNARNAKIIADASFHGQTFSQRIWGEHQKQLQQSLDKALRQSLILGKGTAPFAKKMSKTMGVTLRNAQRLVSTEMARVQTESASQSMKESGFDEYQIVANPECCDQCKKVNGHHFKLDEKGSADGMPPLHLNCRCSTAAYVDDDTDDDFDEATFDEWSETFDEHGLSWEEWQEQVLSLRTGQALVGHSNTLDHMAPATQFSFSKAGPKGIESHKIKLYQNDEEMNIWTQTYSKDSQTTVAKLKEILPKYAGEFGLPTVIRVVSDKELGSGIAAYDRADDSLLVNEKMFNDNFIASVLDSDYFAAETSEDILIHELTHKRHWDKVRSLQQQYPDKYKTLEDAKMELETGLRSYVNKKRSVDPFYLETVSKNAERGMILRRELNEFIADLSILIKKDRIEDVELLGLFKEVLYDYSK